ncbi:MAG: F0F1 ATP synthase subunit A [Sphingomonadales bacterium]
MTISPDQWIFWTWDGFQLNATIALTWLVMALLCTISWVATARLTDQDKPGRWQNLLEVVVGGIRDQIADIGVRDPDRYMPFIGTLFLYIAMSNLLAVVPAYRPPTGSLSTTTALALSVLVAVPLYAISDKGVRGYLKNYIRPTLFMLPFNIIGELSRTIALAVRLYGNVMSGTVIVGILISVAPFIFPIVMQLLGMLTGLIQAYIFAVLAMVYIASAARSHGGEPRGSSAESSQQGD